MIDGLVKVADKRSFWKLVEKVFTDGQINWGRIIVLFYSVGKLSAKVLDPAACYLFKLLIYLLFVDRCASLCLYLYS